MLVRCAVCPAVAVGKTEMESNEWRNDDNKRHPPAERNKEIQKIFVSERSQK